MTDKPVAWIIENVAKRERLLSEKPLPRGADELGWTETPLYPATTLEVARREALTEDDATVERVARAIAATEYGDGCAEPHELWIAHARAAIRALIGEKTP
jgi:hypothetical protein